MNTANSRTERKFLEMQVSDPRVDTLQEQYDSLLEQLKWTHAVLAIIVEEQGGLVKIDRSVLETYNLATSMDVWLDPSDNSVNIRVNPVEDQ